MCFCPDNTSSVNFLLCFLLVVYSIWIILFLLPSLPTGGAGVAEQIADLKRGSEIVVCTPGRMIDILCMQAGKLVSLKRVTMVVMDEADRYACSMLLGVWWLCRVVLRN